MASDHSCVISLWTKRCAICSAPPQEAGGWPGQGQGASGRFLGMPAVPGMQATTKAATEAEQRVARDLAAAGNVSVESAADRLAHAIEGNAVVHGRPGIKGLANQILDRKQAWHLLELGAESDPELAKALQVIKDLADS